MEKQREENGRSPRKRNVNILVHVFLAVLAVIWVMPIFWIVLTSFRAEPGAYTSTFLPKAYTLNNYVKLLTDRNVLNFPRMFKNTLIIAICSCCISTSFVLSVSYSLSRMRFKFRKPYMNIAMILGLFPGMLTMIILYRVLKDLGLTQANAVPGLILVYIASSGMGYYVSKGFFDTIPKSLDEAARIDGATRAQVLWKIILPLAGSIVIYTLLTGFMGPWGDYVFASYISFGNSSGMNVAVGMYNWLTPDQINNNYTMFCAGGVVVAIPVVILFMCLQKYYVEGVTGGAVKG